MTGTEIIRLAHMRKLQLAADRFFFVSAVICRPALLSGQTGNGLPRAKFRRSGLPRRPRTNRGRRQPRPLGTEAARILAGNRPTVFDNTSNDKPRMCLSGNFPRGVGQASLRIVAAAFPEGAATRIQENSCARRSSPPSLIGSGTLASFQGPPDRWRIGQLAPGIARRRLPGYGFQATGATSLWDLGAKWPLSCAKRQLSNLPPASLLALRAWSG